MIESPFLMWLQDVEESNTSDNKDTINDEEMTDKNNDHVDDNSEE